ncbi:DUF1917 domain-containing protein [Agrobacterium rhizogenes]|uniref:putative phosphothreonine lyase domain-containing protein n=1 Tax=Rhizobium rhizogenes TaxID=359 RepID=UPI00115EA778|nr:putative phosphothreonine lyase domain-containg protein [Rhizobium rhizogenes]NTI03175.1 DUF1917 domain-containing protein [Rhizobium rhizogenes]NTI09979.1 DUF1917 domain-containing protein [Rhizobium rhizogenes]TRB21498.1 DUF1917 domain-containing protein [Rhizobium rhizogenes]
MFWHSTISKHGFRSNILGSDEASTGKWLVSIPNPDIGLTWEDIEGAVVEGRLLAVKKSTATLRKKLGHDLVCIYCSASDVDTVVETLRVLREIGVDGDLRYKSDRATFDGREEYLWSSNDFEGLALKAF